MPGAATPTQAGGAAGTHSASGTAWFELPGQAGRLQLWPQRAAYDPDLGLLLVADAHLGKAVSFRRLGVPVTEATTGEALARLDGLIVATGAHGIVFLGDLLHSARSHAVGTMADVRAWRARHADLGLTLVRGKHDQHAGDPPAVFPLRCSGGRASGLRPVHRHVCAAGRAGSAALRHRRRCGAGLAGQGLKRAPSVRSGQRSVRNGEAGSPAPLTRLASSALSTQP